MDVDGRCCGTQVLDGEGRCCATNVDGCGVCGGRGVLDVEGRCCEGGQLDAAGACCEDGTVDECGVCDGDGTSCGVVLEIAGDATTARGGAVVESVLVGLSGSGTVLPLAQHRPWTVVSLTGIADMGRAAQAWPQAVGIRRRPVCGNGVCELDEVGVCTVDCPLPWRECECASAAVGGCLVATGTCVCWAGYEGARCEACAPGFARDAGGACSFVVQDGVRQQSGSASSGGVVLALGIVAGVLGVVVVVVTGALVVVVVVRKRELKGARRGGRYRVRRRASSVQAMLALHMNKPPPAAAE